MCINWSFSQAPETESESEPAMKEEPSTSGVVSGDESEGDTVVEAKKTKKEKAGKKAEKKKKDDKSAKKAAKKGDKKEKKGDKKGDKKADKKGDKKDKVGR